MFKKILFGISLFVSIIFILNPCLAGPGSTGANFLKLGVGARPVGMGEAFVGVADDLNSLYWNPAGLNSIKDKKEVNFMHNVWFEGINYTYLAYGQRMKDFGVLGGSFSFVGYGNITSTKEDNLGDYAGSEGSFSASDICFNISYAERVMGKCDLGVGLNILSSKIENYSAFSFYFNIGLLHQVEKVKNLTLGFAIQNLGTSLKFIATESPLPLNFKIGAGYKVYSDKNNSILTALDVNIPVDNKINLNIGGEYWFRDMLAVRIGYKTLTVSELGTLAGLSAGLGFKWQNYCIDYAFVPYGDLGYTHRISLLAKF